MGPNLAALWDILDFVLHTLRALSPCDPRTDASDHIFVLGIFILILLLLVVVVVLLGELLGDIKLDLTHG